MLFVDLGAVILAGIVFILWYRSRRVSNRLVEQVEDLEDATKEIREFKLDAETLTLINKERQALGRNPLVFDDARRVAEWRASLSPLTLVASAPGGRATNLDSTYRFLTYYEPVLQDNVDNLSAIREGAKVNNGTK